MELNLDRLNGLAYSDFRQIPAVKQPSTTPTEPQKQQGEYESTTAEEKRLERQIEGLGAFQRKADQNKAEQDRTLEVYKTYQENIKKSGQLQTDILKGIKAGEDIYRLFLKAVEAIGCMTSNKTFYTQIEADIKSIYGVGLQEPTLLMLELEETKERLTRLREALNREIELYAKESIQRAVKVHEAKIADLESLIKRERITE